MTTTAPAPTAPAAIAPATRFRRRATGVAAIVGGLLTAAGFVATVWETSPDKIAYLDSLVVDPVRSQVAAVLLHYGYLGIVPVLLALGIMTRGRGTIAGNVGLVLGLPGAIALPGLLVTDFYDLAIRQHLPDDQAVAVSDAAQNLPGAAFLGGPLIMLVFVGMTVAGFAAAWAGSLHWAPVLLVVASFVTLVVLPVGPLSGILSGSLLGAFMIVVGIAALRTTDRRWVTGEH